MRTDKTTEEGPKGQKPNRIPVVPTSGHELRKMYETINLLLYENQPPLSYLGYLPRKWKNSENPFNLQ